MAVKLKLVAGIASSELAAHRLRQYAINALTNMPTDLSDGEKRKLPVRDDDGRNIGKLIVEND